jgi:hypothetical protein
VTEREAPVNWDIDYLPDDVDNGGGWYGHEPGTEPIPVAQIHDELGAQGEDNASDDYLDETPRDTGRAAPLASPSYSSSISTLTFKVAPPPWYRTKKALFGAVGAAAVAAVVVLTLRIPGGDAEESTPGAPNASTTAAPTPTSAQPTPSSALPAPPPPPLLPPPPPPPLASDAPGQAPVHTGGNQRPRSAAPSQTQQPPQIDVTRAPISVAPPRWQAPGADSSTPGDAPKRRGGWPW